MVMEDSRNKVITPQVNDRSPKYFNHSITKPKRNLPFNNRLAVLNLPSIKSTIWKTVDDTASAAIAEPLANITVENSEEKFKLYEKVLYVIQLQTPTARAIGSDDRYAEGDNSPKVSL